MRISGLGPSDPGRSDKAEERHDGSGQRTDSGQHGAFKQSRSYLPLFSSALYMRCCDKAILD